MSIMARPAKAAHLVKSANIKPGQITITLDLARIAKELKTTLPHMDGGQNDDNGQDAIITAPFQLRKRGVETKLIIGGSTTLLDQILIRNIARAYQWYLAIKRGTTVDQIAEQERLSIARIRQMINHAFIAPDIVTAILKGSQPVGLTSNHIQRNALPPDWQNSATCYPACSKTKTSHKKAPNCQGRNGKQRFLPDWSQYRAPHTVSPKRAGPQPFEQ